MNGRVWFFRGENKYIDDVLAARINQRGDILSAENIESPADQGKSFIRKILYRRDKREFAVEPGLHGVLIRGSHISKMPWLERAER